MNPLSRYQRRLSHTSFAADKAVKIFQHSKGNRFVSELVYNECQPSVAQLLIPLLQQLSRQSRWLLWLTPQQRLSRSWLQQAKLPANKVMQLNQISPMATVQVMEKALLTGNYSVVLGWLPDLTSEDYLKLSQAAALGNTYGFVMHPRQKIGAVQASCSAPSIHFSLYH